MKIADFYFSGRLDDGPLQVDAKKSGAKAGDTLGKSMASSLKAHSKDLVSGIKLGAGIAAFGGLTAAASGLVSVMGDAIQAAREDEESQARLGAALKANIPNWDGNTKAIEDTIASRQRLGFTDEEQRTSLALLVVATKDSTKALELQRAAMDLARLKNISLADASSALIKIEGGQFRALKALGIQLPKNATATEALAAVQKAAAGSAEDFAKTSQGRLLASQIKVGEAMEKLGYTIMPAVTDALVFAADAVSNLMEFLDDIKPITDAVGVAFDVLGNVVQSFGDKTKNVTPELLKQMRALNQISEADYQAALAWLAHQEAMDDAGTSLKDVADRGGRTETALTTLGKQGIETGDDLAEGADKARRAYSRLKVNLLADATSIVTDYYDVLIMKDDLAATNAEINALRKIAASRRLTAEETANLHKLEQTQAQLVSDLAEHGETQSGIVQETLDDLYTQLYLTHGKEKKIIEAEIRRLQLLTAAAKIANGAVLTLGESIAATLAKGGYISAAGAGAGAHGGGKAGGTGLGRASGGPVQAGVAYPVNENTPRTEWFVPSVTGRIMTASQMASSSGGPSGGDTYNVNLLAGREIHSVRDIGGSLRDLGEQGWLKPRKR